MLNRKRILTPTCGEITLSTQGGVNIRQDEADISVQMNIATSGECNV